jgi:hypothetical protein
MEDDWWLQHIFGQSLATKTDPDNAKLAADVPPRDALGLMTRLFWNCGSLLAPLSDRQVAEGLVFLGSAGESAWMYYVYDPSIDRSVRFDCIRSIDAVYRDCFARRCPNSPANRSSSDLNTLDNVCFMWWDRFPSGGLPTTSDEEREAVYLQLVEVMAKTLRIENAACQESALHGLGHFGGPDVKRAKVAIDDWLVSHPHSALRAYAEAARERNVQ